MRDAFILVAYVTGNRQLTFSSETLNRPGMVVPVLVCLGLPLLLQDSYL